MIRQEVTIINKLGLHARAAAKLVTCASRFQSSVPLNRGGHRVNGKSIMGVMMLAASQGTLLTLELEGPDELEACQALVQLIGERFGEDA